MFNYYFDLYCSYLPHSVLCFFKTVLSIHTGNIVLLCIINTPAKDGSLQTCKDVCFLIVGVKRAGESLVRG